PVQVPMPVLVVDSVNEQPTANLPGVAESLPLVSNPKEFEVAAIKPTPPDFRGMRSSVQRGGRVNFEGMTLKRLITQAWGVNAAMVMDAPKWADTDRYDVIAKAPAGEGPTGATDMDAVNTMMRALLADRFKLVVHEE